jgi:hypothetical protein
MCCRISLLQGLAWEWTDQVVGAQTSIAGSYDKITTTEQQYVTQEIIAHDSHDPI